MDVILLSPVGGRASYSIIEYFKNKSYYVVGIDQDSEAIGKYFVDKFIQVPRVGESSYEECLYRIIQENRVSFFVTSLDPEIVYWNKIYYNKGFNYLMDKVFTFNIMDNIMSFVDKLDFYKILIENDFLAPLTLPLYEDILKDKKIIFPLIIKPVTSYGSRNIFIVGDEEELKLYLHLIKLKFSDINQFIVQSYIDGKEYSIDFFCVNGELINSVIRERVRKESVSLIGQVVNDSTIGSMLKIYSSKLHLSGLHNLQIIAQDSNIYIIEHNVRYSGTIALSIASGVDLFNNLIEYKMNGVVTRYGTPKTIRMVRFYKEIYM